MNALLVTWLLSVSGVGLRISACRSLASCQVECYTARWWADAVGRGLMRLSVAAGLCVLMLGG